MSSKELNGNILQRIKHYPKLGLVILVFVAFIALGMPDGLIGVAWPSIRGSFSLPLDALGGLLFASVAGYMTSSFLSGRIMSFLGVGRLLAVSCTLTGIALIGYTLVPAWWMMVALGILTGLGAGGIDAGLNTYVAAHFSERLMQWLHASYGAGVTLGPLIMIFALNTFQSWRAGYLIVGGFQLLLAVCFTLTLPMWVEGASRTGIEPTKRLTDYDTPLVETLLQPRVWLSMGLFFLYTGAEIGFGTWSYSLLTESRRVEPGVAALLVGSYWAMFTIGRITAGLYTSRVGVERLVLGGMFAALVGSILLWWNPGAAANLVAVCIIGFAIAPIFPGLVSRTSHRVSPRFTANTIGMQLAAGGLGAAILPSLMGVLSRRISLEVIPVFLAVLFALQLAMFWASEVNPAARVVEKV